MYRSRLNLKSPSLEDLVLHMRVQCTSCSRYEVIYIRIIVSVKLISIGPILHALAREVEGSVLALPPSACRYISCRFSSIDLSFTGIRFSSQLFK